MRNLTNTPVIAFANQKGGVGKSTLTTLIANHFYFQKQLQVAIIDADFPQHTIVKRRHENANYIQSKTHLLKHTAELYRHRKPIQLKAVKIEAVPSMIQALQQKVDIIFLDIAGTLNLRGIPQALQCVNHFFIPVLQDFDTFKSSSEFFEVMSNKIFPASQAFRSCHFVLNNLPYNNLENTYRKKIGAIGGKTTQHNMYHHVAYERNFRSSLLPIPEADEKKMYYNEIQKLNAFADEVFSLCFEKNQEQPKRIEAPVSV